jgi:enoyl-CoA hydratase/carnithine racemase
MSVLTDYQNRYGYIRFRRQDGILEMTIHDKGGSARWSAGETGIHRQLGDAFWDIAHDRENKVVILTGAGDVFIQEFDWTDQPTELNPSYWYRIYKEGKDLLNNMLDIEVPVIAAVNGNAFIHSEIPVLADIVLAADTARFADKIHFPTGVVPGDGVHVVWTMLLGPNRGRYFLMTGQEITAQEALQLGIVGEVLPKAKLMERAWEHARDLLKKPEIARRYTRVILTQQLKRRLMEDLSYGLMAEGLGINDTASSAIPKSK